MTSENYIPAKRGPKPIGTAPMTSAERKRRSREQIRATGAKDFILRVEGPHLQVLESFAEGNNMSVSEALRQLMEPTLDRFAGIVRRCNRMTENGAPDEAVAAFMQAHLFPPLPYIEEKKETISENN